MNAAAPQFLIDLEASGFAAAIRQSVWLYPAANIAHVVAVTVFAGAVTVMDLKLLGAFRGAPPLPLVRIARRAAMAAFAAVACAGFLLFAAEASHIALNPVFLTKLGLIAFGLANAVVLGRLAVRGLAGAGRPSPIVRATAIISLATWITVVALGRLIAYV